MINIEQIAEDFKIKNTNHYADQDYYSENVVKAIKEALRQAIPEILEEVANKAKIIEEHLNPLTDLPKGEAHINTHFVGDLGYEDYEPVQYTIYKDSITSLSESLIEKYTK